MKNQFIISAFLLVTFIGFSQENSTVKEYSYSELIQMIKAEKDTLFRLSKAKITYNAQTDSLFLLKDGESKYVEVGKGTRKDTLHIRKTLIFQDVQFTNRTPDRQSWIGFYKVKFHENVAFLNPKGLVVNACHFKKGFALLQSQNNDENEIFSSRFIFIQKSLFTGGSFFLQTEESDKNTLIFFTENKVYLKRFGIYNGGGRDLNFYSNQLDVQKFLYNENKSNMSNNRSITFIKNTIKANYTGLNIKPSENSSHTIAKNTWKTAWIAMSIDNFTSKNIWINWNQFSKKMIDYNIYYEWMQPKEFSAFDKKGFEPESEIDNETSYFTDRNLKHYIETVRIQDLDVYNAEQALKGKFYDYYKARHEIAAANEVYIEIKDLETQRLGHLNMVSPSFKTFFKWRINQFLKVFSGYGTEPERAVIFSMYVILLFAFIYLLFPNSWDKHGKNRIVNRYRFFTKYMNKEAGIHEVYLEDQQKEILASEDFKEYMLKSEKTIPSFFLKTAIPLYKWSIAGIKFSAIVLKRIDIMKGSWSELPKSKRIWKSFLLIGAFLIAIVYDIFIKMLNALMLSINTFTTLGFGEIPIKGLPRYLAIIQGFIGWFMLTIFSVSLISQLLN